MGHHHPLTKSVFLCGPILVFCLAATEAFADCPNPTPAKGQINMLVVGDSIMWGQGLKREQKFWWRVKCWIQEKTGKQVNERIEAHSGAVMDAANASPSRFTSSDGEVNLDLPSIHQQIDQAAKHYAQINQNVDLILLDGCINDVGVRNLLNPTTTFDSLRNTIKVRCGTEMTQLLRRTVEMFPSAHVIVTGYYRIVSTDTADNRFVRMLVKNINSDRPEIKRMKDREIREKLITISDLWYKVSTSALAEAVAKVNAELGAQDRSPRVRFVEIQFGPEHSFSASDTLLWNFVFGSTNLSGIRNLLVILSFGTDAYKPNDRVRESRDRSCKETFKAPKGVKETPEEKKRRKDTLLLCRYASLGHPNHMGALIYTEGIKGQLLYLIEKAGEKLVPVSQ